MQGIEEEINGGLVQATLRWFGDADLDLNVRTPDGSTIRFSNREADNGMLEFDTIPRCGDVGLNLENVFFPVDPSQPILEGTYTVFAELFSDNNCGDVDSGLPIDFTLVLKVDGQELQSLTGSFNDDGNDDSEELVATFSLQAARL